MANAPRVTYGQGIARHHGKRTYGFREQGIGTEAVLHSTRKEQGIGKRQDVKSPVYLIAIRKVIVLL